MVLESRPILHDDFGEEDQVRSFHKATVELMIFPEFAKVGYGLVPWRACQMQLD